MSETPYAKVQSGGQFLAFVSRRKLDNIEIPKYVFDLWMPLLGADGLGVYSTYCRLERSELVRGRTMKWLASEMRMGAPRLRAINTMLEDCGMIEICKPQGQERWDHMPTTIIVKDAPPEVTVELIRKYRPSIGTDRYEPLSPQLVSLANAESKEEEPKRRTTIDAGRCAAFDNIPDIAPSDETDSCTKGLIGFLDSSTTLDTSSHTDEDTPTVTEEYENVELQPENPNGDLGEIERNEQKSRRKIDAGFSASRPIPKRAEPKRGPNPALVPVTPGSLYLFEMLGKEMQARGRDPAKQFRSLVSKQELETAEGRMGMEALQRAVQAGLRKGVLSVAELVGYVVKSAGNGSPAKSTLPPLLFQKVAEAIRYDPEAQEHIPRISRLTETCQQRGYSPEEVRKAGRLWWETWPGNTGTGPKDAEFLQKIVIVKKERL